MDLSEILEPHNVAGLLKLHYREMKLCLIPRGEMSREITRAAKARDVSLVKDHVILSVLMHLYVCYHRWMQLKISSLRYLLKTLL